MAKQLEFDADARASLKRGVDRVADAVKITIGPNGRETVVDDMEKGGKDGVITVDESRGLATELDLVEGMLVDKGYVSAYMVTNAQRIEAVLEDAYILITDKTISAIADLLPILE